jgi:ATP-dependent protease Clp ATPase subunit
MEFIVTKKPGSNARVFRLARCKLGEHVQHGLETRLCAQITTEMNSVVVVVGPTGTGKSKLAVEIAKAFGGEVINADAFQVARCTYDDLVTCIMAEVMRTAGRCIVDLTWAALRSATEPEATR